MEQKLQALSSLERLVLSSLQQYAITIKMVPEVDAGANAVSALQQYLQVLALARSASMQELFTELAAPTEDTAPTAPTAPTEDTAPTAPTS